MPSHLKYLSVTFQQDVILGGLVYPTGTTLSLQDSVARGLGDQVKINGPGSIDTALTVANLGSGSGGGAGGTAGAATVGSLIGTNTADENNAIPSWYLNNAYALADGPYTDDAGTIFVSDANIDQTNGYPKVAHTVNISTASGYSGGRYVDSGQLKPGTYLARILLRGDSPNTLPRIGYGAPVHDIVVTAGVHVDFQFDWDGVATYCRLGFTGGHAGGLGSVSGSGKGALGRRLRSRQRPRAAELRNRSTRTDSTMAAANVEAVFGTT